MSTPWRLRVHIAGCLATACVAPFLAVDWGRVRVAHGQLLTVTALLLLSVLNVEIGRALEGGVAHAHRPHKVLSAWVFAAALLLPTWWLGPLAAVTYAHTRWRGLRLPLWKWVGSGAYVVLAGLAAAVTARSVQGPRPDWMLAQGGRGLVAVLCAGAVFLLVEVLLFHGSAYLNDAEDEVWLRRTLAGPSFYLTEAAVLTVSGLSAAIWTGAAWFVLLTPSVYALAQRAALHEPLRERANIDAKTGLLRFEAWRQMAVVEADRCSTRHRSWSLLFVDLDHFKHHNDTWGHLAGDAALAAVAEALRGQLRSRDVLGRFGGEEFCVLLPDTPLLEALAIAERLRSTVATLRLHEPEAGVTVSIGVAGVDAVCDPPEFAEVLVAGDRAMMDAKAAGRDTVRAREVHCTEPVAQPVAQPVARPVGHPLTEPDPA
jgi:diguanylate cyclase (GGDEF)-like protein